MDLQQEHVIGHCRLAHPTRQHRRPAPQHQQPSSATATAGVYTVAAEQTYHGGHLHSWQDRMIGDDRGIGQTLRNNSTM
jgi:hypothetical protein